MGVFAMFGSLLILVLIPLLDLSRIRGATFRPLMKFAFWALIVDFLILMWIGSQHPEQPFVTIGQYATSFYFAWFLMIVPAVGLCENSLFDLGLISKRKGAYTFQ
jgi:ubiquinol-cytochrome c reductase cytochrome b subunit